MTIEKLYYSLNFKKIVCLGITKNKPRKIKCKRFNSLKIAFVEHINLGGSI